MNNLIHLIKGELIRLYKYKILIVGIIVSLIWVLIIGLSEKAEIEPLISILMGMDATVMVIMLLAASFYFEKQEGSIKSILVAPIKLIDVIITKVVVAVIISLISAFLVALTALIIHNIQVNLLLMVLYIFIIVISHTAIGFVITLFSKDFGSMIGMYGGFMIITLLPTILHLVGVIPERFSDILIISPFHASEVLLNSLFVKTDVFIIMISAVYLTSIAIILYTTIVYKKYKRYAIEG